MAIRGRVRPVSIVTTADGSDTLFVPDLQEHYHSTFGAMQESDHLFIGQGFLALNRHINPVTLLEMGFGTGLNALLTALTARAQQRAVYYEAVELYPLRKKVWGRLNYPYRTGTGLIPLFSLLHESNWNENIPIDDLFWLTKHHRDIREISLPANHFDLIYYDAFGPEVQPELWIPEVFQKMYQTLKPGGILVTYSVKGSVQRAMKETGFTTYKLPGPPGKREILRAIKS